MGKVGAEKESIVKSIGVVLLGAILAAAAWVAFHILPAMGVFNDLDPLLVGDCRRVDIAPGTEDVEIDENAGQVFISTFERRGWYAGDTENRPRGEIYLLDLADRTLTPKPISQDGPADFSPHGISLWTGADGERRLFVVNHRTDGTEAVEMFDVSDDGSLFHTETVSFDDMYSPNDVTAVGERQFYASNDRKYETGALGVAEVWGALPFTDVVYFDGVAGRSVARGLTYANGIARSLDGEEIYVAEVTKRRISAYARDKATGDLTFEKRWRVKTAPDNIDVAPDGALWIAGHPNTTKFLKHAGDASVIAPSHVLRLDPQTGISENKFVSLNGEINGSSVGAASENTLIVGAVFDGHVMVCPLE